jgi:hypothetical protein
LGRLAQLAIALIIVLIVAEVVWHGVTMATFERIRNDLVEPPDGPVRVRLILQPLMATFFAISGGITETRCSQSQQVIGRSLH